MPTNGPASAPPDDGASGVRAMTPWIVSVSAASTSGADTSASFATRIASPGASTREPADRSSPTATMIVAVPGCAAASSETMSGPDASSAALSEKTATPIDSSPICWASCSRSDAASATSDDTYTLAEPSASTASST